MTSPPPRVSIPEGTTPEGAAGLAAIAADPCHALIALDFDGTLAPIVSEPSAAHVARGNQVRDVDDPHPWGDPGGDSVAGGDESVVKPVVGEEREAIEGGHER